MTAEPTSDVLRWVTEGERLFGEVLQTLHQCREVTGRAELLVVENQRLQDEMQAMREELHHLRAERVEAAETLKAFAEHVTQLATLALQRLGRRTS